MCAIPQHPHILFPQPLQHGVESAHTRTIDAMLASFRERGARLVFTNGCFDILHPGHVDLLARARAEGDVLIVGLNSDTSVQRQGKKPERPMVPFAARAFVLAHLASVDAVIGFEEDTPFELISRVQPAVLVKGGDWSEDRIVGGDSVRKNNGRVLSLPLLQGFSTTSLIERIAARVAQV